MATLSTNMASGYPSTAEQSDVSNDVCEQLSTLSLSDNKEQESPSRSKKDPRRIARKYQINLCMKALEENIIIYLGTGSGKTHIAVLLMYEMEHLIKKPQKNICIFLAPTVALVQQQAKVIEESVDLKVGTYCGNSTRIKGHQDWEKEIEEYEVLVMTPQLLLHYLSHCFIKMEQIALLIFDECHYAQLESDHPYAQIMKIFYKVDLVKHPRIFGMTASPKLGKGGSISGLEALLHAKVYTVKDKDELEQYVTSPKVNIYYHDSMEKGYSIMTYVEKLEEIKNKCMLTLGDDSYHSSLISTRKLLQKVHSDIRFCLENLGLWGALQASYISLMGDHYETSELVEVAESCNDDKLCKNYLCDASSALASDCTRGGVESAISCIDDLKEPFFSRKILQLIGILSSFRLQSNMKCIIFVNRIITARSLSNTLQNLKVLSSWKCDFLVGVHSRQVSRKNTASILEKFRSGELNLLIATKVGEEGLDIQTCSLVIRFDLPETLSSFIQSRGRARMPQSEYVLLVDSGNPREVNLIEQFKKDEALINEEISSRKSPLQITDFKERTYKVEITGATISSLMSVQLLHHYCSKLPHDEYFNPKLQFFYSNDSDGTVCNIILPTNAPIRQIVSIPQPSTEAAKRDACLKACQALHEVGALTDYLLPEQDDNYEESSQDLSDSDNEDDVESRLELHQMLVPAALRVPWTEVGNFTCFSCYYIKFSPNPADRIYRRFGLFVKEPLPEEAGNLKLDLHLARGRMVMAQLIPSGVARFDKVQIASAEKFQKVFLKILLDRHEFIPEYVPLEDNDVLESSSSTFYLLLPVVEHECDKFSVDWTLIKRCLSSPIFKYPNRDTEDDICLLTNHLHLADGCTTSNDTLNSLVYLPCKDTFFFISDILAEKNAYSPYNESKGHESKSHVEHYAELYDIHLEYPHQPLLKAKPLFLLDNLLRKKNRSGEWREKEEYFVELPPEICQLKFIGFSRDIGSSLSLLPSIMHRLESFLVAIELKDKLIASVPEAVEVTTNRILEAITTERCNEQFSLERLEVLGDAFLKFAAGRHLFLKHNALDEGQLTRKRSNIINNRNLRRLATRKKIQVYIRDQMLEPGQFFAFGRPCPITCNKETEKSICPLSYVKKNGTNVEVRCSKGHHWLHKKTIADVVESLIGAFIVDSGFKAATAFLTWIGIQVDFSTSQTDNICHASKVFLPLANQMDVNALENILGHEFTHKGLLIQAFVHPSFNNLGGCYQRLEFLGDAVLDYLVTSYLYTAYPKLKPGHLTDLRSMSVCNLSFANVAGRWSFHKFMICDSSDLRESMTKYVNEIGTSASVTEHIEERTCPKALGDLVESCMGAILLDTGFNLSYMWKIMTSLLDPVVRVSKMHLNPLRELRELCESYNWDLQFSTLKKDGKLSVEATINEERVSATASAINISGKTAKRVAARQLFECLKAQGFRSKSISLKEVLQETEKQEAVLIGFDEVPCVSELLEVQEGSRSSYSGNVYPLCKTSPAIHLNNASDAGPHGTGAPTISAKSHLYQICAVNYWKPPVFDCWKEAGPDHFKEFVFKVVVEIAKNPKELFEFYGEPRSRKKDAAEHAAEGALWYLKHEGYM